MYFCFTMQVYSPGPTLDLMLFQHCFHTDVFSVSLVMSSRCFVDATLKTFVCISSDWIKRLGPHRLPCKLLTAQNPDELLLLWYFKKSWNLSVFMFVSAHVMNYWAVSKKIRAIDLSEHVIDAWFKLITDSNHRAVCVCVCLRSLFHRHTNTQRAPVQSS